jgi:hypothetical protein
MQAALWTLATLLEPHLGLAACLSVFLWVPRARTPLLLGGVLLGFMTLHALGAAGAVEYVSRVLPAAARAGATDLTQYSLTALLTTLGMATSPAVTLGGISSLIMLALGCALARSSARATGSASLLVLLPPALMLLGGTHVHLSQMPVALPAMLLLRAKVPEAGKVLTLAVIATAIPWSEAINALDLLLPLTLCSVFVIAHERLPWPTIALAATLASALPFILFLTEPNLSPRGGFPAPNARELAEIAWGVLLQTHPHPPAWWSLTLRLPTWLALSSLLIVSCASVKGRDSVGSTQAGGAV